MADSGTPAMREPHVTHQIARLEKTISELTEMINRLEARITPVLTDDDLKPTPDRRDEQKAERIVPLAQTMAEHIDRLQGQSARLNVICNRIEL